jgi:hypothetical protein
MDETYIKVKGEWVYLYRAFDSHGDNRPYGYRGLKIFTSLKLRFQDFQRWLANNG